MKTTKIRKRKNQGIIVVIYMYFWIQPSYTHMWFLSLSNLVLFVVCLSFQILSMSK